MNITISDNNSSLKYIQSNKLIVTAHQKKAVRSILIHCAIVISLISYDIITFNNCGWISGIGIAYLFGIITSLGRLNKDKNKFITDLRAIMNRHFSLSNKEILTINNEFIKLDSDVIKYEYKWTVITSYMVKDTFIFLLKDSTFSSCVLIDKKLINEVDLNELITFLNNNKLETKEFNKPL